MPDDRHIVITSVPARSRPPIEICEHKGVGHPDSICDGVADALSRALSLAYLRAHGAVQHHNVDKALLVGGRSAPRFGGGEVQSPMRLIVSGRATPLPDRDMTEFARGVARSFLATTLRCDPDLFSIESAISAGSPNLIRVMAGGTANPLANDTSVGVACAPYSPLERAVLDIAGHLHSSNFLRTFPAAGDDFKVMGLRRGDAMQFTIALAFIDREVAGPDAYLEIKRAVVRYLKDNLDAAHEIRINLLDRPHPVAESDVYLTVTGLSAEQGDDGEVGRGNRVNGLITPARAMSLEAAAGKNPVTHTGKLYNVAALQIARAIAAELAGVQEVSVQMLSTIGQPIAQPEMVAIELFAASAMGSAAEQRARQIVRSQLDRITELSERLIRGELPVF
jgi:S-adenosylmethionine synthetase